MNEKTTFDQIAEGEEFIFKSKAHNWKERRFLKVKKADYPITVDAIEIETGKRALFSPNVTVIKIT